MLQQDCTDITLKKYVRQVVCEIIFLPANMCKSWLAGWGAAKSYWKDKAFLVRPATQVHTHMHLHLHRNTHTHTSTVISVFVRNLHRLSFLFPLIWMLFAMNNLGRINFELLSFWKQTKFTLTHAEVLCVWTTRLHTCTLKNRHTK